MLVGLISLRRLFLPGINKIVVATGVAPDHMLNLLFPALAHRATNMTPLRG